MTNSESLADYLASQGVTLLNGSPANLPDGEAGDGNADGGDADDGDRDNGCECRGRSYRVCRVCGCSRWHCKSTGSWRC